MSMTAEAREAMYRRQDALEAPTEAYWASGFVKPPRVTAEEAAREETARAEAAAKAAVTCAAKAAAEAAETARAVLRALTAGNARQQTVFAAQARAFAEAARAAADVADDHVPVKVGAACRYEAWHTAWAAVEAAQAAATGAEVLIRAIGYL